MGAVRGVGQFLYLSISSSFPVTISTSLISTAKPKLSSRRPSNDDADRAAIKKTISRSRGNGDYTDIGNALDVVKAQIATRTRTGSKSTCSCSQTASKRLRPPANTIRKMAQFNHEFLANTKTIQEKGWKVMILGIGNDTAAKDLAQQLSGSYTEVSNTPTLGSLTEPPEVCSAGSRLTARSPPRPLPARRLQARSPSH